MFALEPMSRKHILFCLWFLYYVVLQAKAQSPPKWEDNMPCPIIIQEDVLVGSILINVTAIRGISNANMTMYMDNTATQQLVKFSGPWNPNNNSLSNSVVLIKELDRDYEQDKRNLVFGVTDGTHSIQYTCLMIITDVNDNPPLFQGLPYQTEPLENLLVGSVIFTNITTFDPDESPSVSYTMAPDPTNQVIFSLRSISDDMAEIVLEKTLDYEMRNAYNIKIIARDNGGLNSSADVVVNVQDVQDTPPYFMLDIYRAAIKENEPVDTKLIQVSAEDGDRGKQNRVIYSIVQGRSDFFFINETSGWISTKFVLDRDDRSMVDSDGVFDLVVQASELNDILPQYGNTTSSVHVTVRVEDVNDNYPRFNTTSPYTAFVREDTPEGSLIYFEGDGYMRVVDEDQGFKSYFRLSIVRDGQPFTMFAPSPVDVFSEAYVLIRLMNASELRALRDSHLSFQVIATEVSTPEQYSGKAEVVLSIQKTEIETTTETPQEQEQVFTAPDIMVFVVAFLVLLNVATSIFICFLVRSRLKKEQRLSRNGSKYKIKTTTNAEHGNHNNVPEMTEVDPEVSVFPRDNHQEVAQ